MGIPTLWTEDSLLERNDHLLKKKGSEKLVVNDELKEISWKNARHPSLEQGHSTVQHFVMFVKGGEG